VRALHRVGAGQTGELPAVRDERHGVHPGNVRIALGHVADAAADLERRLCHVETEHAHAAARRHDEPEQRLDHRALAGAVRAQESHRAGRKRRRHVAQRRVLAVLNGHVFERDDGRDVRHPDSYTKAVDSAFE
jgi:hypothetical protein